MNDDVLLFILYTIMIYSIGMFSGVGLNMLVEKFFDKKNVIVEPLGKKDETSDSNKNKELSIENKDIKEEKKEQEQKPSLLESLTKRKKDNPDEIEIL